MYEDPEIYNKRSSLSLRKISQKNHVDLSTDIINSGPKRMLTANGKFFSAGPYLYIYISRSWSMANSNHRFLNFSFYRQIFHRRRHKYYQQSFYRARLFVFD